MKRTPLKRKTRLKVKGKSRFPKRRNDAYRKWIRGFWCEASYADFSVCGGVTDCAHLKSRGAGGDDVGNCVPLCRKHHMEQHEVGLATFQHKYLIDLRHTASDLGRRWREQQGETAA